MKNLKRLKSILKIKKLGYNWTEGWSFVGRYGGWFVLLCNNKDINKTKTTW